jgi:16S rRNA processing protein RimM
VNRQWKVADLAQSEVFDINGERLGILVDVLPTGGNDVWVIKTDLPRMPELLLPALNTVVREVDPDKKHIVVELPAGLKQIYESPEKEKSATHKQWP